MRLEYLGHWYDVRHFLMLLLCGNYPQSNEVSPEKKKRKDVVWNEHEIETDAREPFRSMSLHFMIS